MLNTRLAYIAKCRENAICGCTLYIVQGRALKLSGLWQLAWVSSWSFWASWVELCWVSRRNRTHTVHLFADKLVTISLSHGICSSFHYTLHSIFIANILPAPRNPTFVFVMRFMRIFNIFGGEIHFQLISIPWLSQAIHFHLNHILNFSLQRWSVFIILCKLIDVQTVWSIITIE